jgi:hypothetical protein
MGIVATDIDQWWAGQLAWLGDQASALQDAGWSYESAALRHGQVGLNETWPILALRLLDEGYGWPQVLTELGLDKMPGSGNEPKLADLTERERDALMAEARERVKREFGLG